MQPPSNNSSPSSIPQNQSPTKKTTVWQKIVSVIKKILLVIAGIILFWASPTFFSMGFLAGLTFEKKIEQLVDKIKTIWTKQKWTIALVIAGAFLSLPVTFTATAFVFAAKCGLDLTKNSHPNKQVILPSSS